MQDGIGSQLPELKPIVEKEVAKKFVRRKGEAAEQVGCIASMPCIDCVLVRYLFFPVDRGSEVDPVNCVRYAKMQIYGFTGLRYEFTSLRVYDTSLRVYDTSLRVYDTSLRVYDTSLRVYDIVDVS